MSDDGSRLGPGGEFDAIREIVRRLGKTAEGIGDDASILEIPRGDKLVVSTDVSIENRHFRADWLSPEEIGYRAVTAALSDLAAMAATPVGILWAVSLPDAWRSKLPALAEGAREAALAVDAKIVGGNLAMASELSIATTVLGTAYRPLRRAGAQPGEKIYVTGKLGGPSTALSALLAGRTPHAASRARFARPAARIDEGRWLADHGATAGIDISDGVAGDARHLAAASGVRLSVHLERLPLMEGAEPSLAVRSGEEYELLVTAASLNESAFRQRFGLDLTAIGEVVAGTDVVFHDHGRAVDIGRGHDHFAIST